MAEEAGVHRFVYDNAEKDNPVVAMEVPSTRISIGAKAVTDWTKVNYRPRLKSNAANLWVPEGGLIKWQWKQDAADTIESEESSLHMGLILRNLRTKVEKRLSITSNDFDNFKASGTDDIVGDIVNFIRIGDYLVPQGFAARIDTGETLHIFMGDDT